MYFSYFPNLSTKVAPKFEKYDKCLGYFACVKIICLCILVTKIYFMIKVYTHFIVNKPQNLYHLLLNTLYLYKGKTEKETKLETNQWVRKRIRVLH